MLDQLINYGKIQNEVKTKLEFSKFNQDAGQSLNSQTTDIIGIMIGSIETGNAEVISGNPDRRESSNRR